MLIILPFPYISKVRDACIFKGQVDQADDQQRDAKVVGNVTLCR